nr:cytochrome ubiquinol oxidase subunit I [Burkholderia gladioli]
MPGAASRAATITLAAALACAAPLAQADTDAESGSGAAAVSGTAASGASPWKITIGPGVYVAPQYPGSRHLKAYPFPALDISYRDRFFSQGPDVLGWNVLSSGDTYHLGMAVSFDFQSRDAAVTRSFSMALWLLLPLVPLQIAIGDAHGLNTREYQPAKIAAIEGIWETEHGGTALNLVGLPDMDAEVTRYAIQLPHLGSLILTHSWDGEIRGLKTFPREDRPYSPIIFWTFRVMAGLGFLMLFAVLLGCWLRRGARLYDSRVFQRFMLWMGPSGIVALLAGWITTEVGRQPWTVYGVLRTEHSVSPLSGQQVGVTLLLFVIVYFLVFGTGVYYMLKLMRKGPSIGHDESQAAHPVLQNRALSRPHDAIDEE